MAQEEPPMTTKLPILCFLCLTLFTSLVIVALKDNSADIAIEPISSIERHNAHTYSMHMDFPQQNIKFTTFRGDGLGAQLHAIMASIAFAQKHPQFEFYYSPLKLHPHGVNITEMDELMNIGADQKQLNSSAEPLPNLDFKDIVETNPSYYYDDEMLRYLRSLTYASKHISNSSDFDVGVHIRRGDIVRNKRRLLSDSYYVHVMKEILYQIERNEIKLNDQNIAYQNKSVAFKYHIGRGSSVKDTLYSLINSDALVMSRSSFSFVPALLSPAKYIYYAPFWHHPLNGWSVVSVYNATYSWHGRGQKHWWIAHNCTDVSKQLSNEILIYKNIHCNIIFNESIAKIQRILVEKGINWTRADQGN
eukprot:517804_1